MGSLLYMICGVVTANWYYNGSPPLIPIEYADKEQTCQRLHPLDQLLQRIEVLKNGYLGEERDEKGTVERNVPAGHPSTTTNN